MENESIKLNESAYRIARQMWDRTDMLGLNVFKLSQGTSVIDAGVNAPGTIEAGIMVSELCMAGLGKVTMVPWSYEDLWLPGVSVETGQPVLACLAAQLAGWPLEVGDFFAMGSGPARAAAAGEEIFQTIGYSEKNSSAAVLFLETDRLPDAETASYAAKECGISPENLWLVAARAASIVGSVQVAARIVETGMHKLHELGYDVNNVVAGYGCCPAAPLAGDSLTALGRVNDCIMYGGSVYLSVKGDDEQVRRIIENVPASGSRDYGKPFLELFEESGRDFYNMDRLLFSPARVVINSLESGKTYAAGKINPDIIKKSIGWSFHG